MKLLLRASLKSLRLLICLFGMSFALISYSVAQTIDIGVILSLSGKNVSQDKGEAMALEVFRADLVSMPYLTLELKDDGSSPQSTLLVAQELIDNGVHALICCTSVEASRLVLPLAQAANVLLISPNELPEGATWGYSLEPSIEKILQSMFLDMASRGRYQLAVMLPDSPLGNEVEAALRRLSVPGGIGILEIVRYRFGVSVLTPEALWVATRQPDAVLIWGEAQDTTLAYQSLRERGFEKQVFVPPAMLRDPSIAKGLEGAFSMLGPAEAAELPTASPAFAAVSAYQRQGAYLFGTEGYSAQGVALYDALNLASAAAESVLSIGIGTETSALRGAMNDIFTNLGTFQGLAASYTLMQGKVDIDANSLVIARATSKIE